MYHNAINPIQMMSSSEANRVTPFANFKNAWLMLSRVITPAATLAPHTLGSWKTKLMSLGLAVLYLLKVSSPSGRTFLVLLVSMLCRLIATLSTLWTGLQAERSRRSRQMMPLV